MNDKHNRHYLSFLALVTAMGCAVTAGWWLRSTDQMAGAIGALALLALGAAILLTFHRHEPPKAEGDVASDNIFLMQSVLDASSDAIFVKNADGRYLLFNPAAARFVGKPVEQVLGNDDTVLFDEHGAKLVRDHDLRVIRSGQTLIEEENLTAANTTRIYLAIKTPLRDRQGRVIGVIGISRDITDRRNAEAALRESERRFSLFMSHIPGLAWIKDAQGRYLYINTPAENVFGPSRDAVLGRSDYELFPLEIANTFMQNDLKVRTTGVPLQTIEQLQHPDGKLHDSLVSKFLIPNPQGGDPLIGGIAIDISEQRQAQQALQLRDRAMQAINQGILITDACQPDNPIVYVNDGFCRITGYRLEEALGNNCRFLQGARTDPNTVAELHRAVQAGEATSVEVVNYRRDGSPFWNALSISPVFDEAGRATHFIGVMTDITQQRQAREQYMQTQKMEVVGQLASGIAHDFGNLLTVIGGYGGIALDDIPDNSPLQEWVREMVSAAARAATLTKQLLAFSRRADYTPVAMYVNQMLSGVERMLRRLIGEDITLTTQFAPDVWPVFADPNQIELIVVNLAINARDAMPDGGTLHLRTSNVTMRSPNHPETDREYVELAVTDTGHGMDEATRARIFEPFFTTKPSGLGTGLGLATVLGLVQQAEGHILVESQPGAGTTFRVYLPRTAELPSSAVVPLSSAESATASSTLLLVEDDQGVRGIAGLELIRAGYVVLAAGSGVEAIEIARSYSGPIHLLLTDFVMPGLSGRVVAESVLEQRPDIKILFMSGYTNDELLRRGIASGEVPFLQKPFTPGTLVARVREVLKGEKPN